MGFKSILKKVGKVALMAAPYVAAPFTGGASLALIGAGAGAGLSALNGGGWKQDLLGAGLGAIPGVAKGFGSGFGSGMSSAVMDGTPEVESGMAGLATPGVTSGLGGLLGGGAGVGTQAATQAATGGKGLDTTTLLKLLGLNVGSAAVGSLIAGKDVQPRVPITQGMTDPNEKAAMEPGHLLYNALKGLSTAGAGEAGKLAKGVTLRTTAQAPPGFAADPAIADPSLLHRDYNGPDLSSMFDNIISPPGTGGPGSAVPRVQKRT